MSYLTTGWLSLIAGSFLIAIGAFLTTKGWNEFSNHSTRRTLISSAIREIDQNSEYLTNMDNAYKQLSKLDQMILFPTFHYNAIQAIQISPLFSKKDGSLLSVASSYLHIVNPTNDIIRNVNNVISRKRPSLQQKKDMYSSFYNSPLLEEFRQNQKDLHEQLLNLK